MTQDFYMTGRNLCILLLASLSFTVVFAKNIYFEHYFSKYHHHHKSSSTTQSVSSESGTIISEASSNYNNFESKTSSNEDDFKSEEVSSSEGNKERNFISNTTLLRSGGPYDDTGRMFLARVATIVGSVLFVVFVLGCIVCCCPKCCRGSERRGFIVGNRAVEILPQPVMTPPPQQPAIVQHLPPEYAQEPVQQFPPQYQQPILPPTQYAPLPQSGYQYSPVQQPSPYSPGQPQTPYSPVHPGFQNPAMLQFYNPPEAPPPYEPTAPTK